MGGLAALAVDAKVVVGRGQVLVEVGAEFARLVQVARFEDAGRLAVGARGDQRSVVCVDVDILKGSEDAGCWSLKGRLV